MAQVSASTPKCCHKTLDGVGVVRDGMTSCFDFAALVGMVEYIECLGDALLAMARRHRDSRRDAGATLAALLCARLLFQAVVFFKGFAEAVVG